MPTLVALAPGTIFARDFRVIGKLSEGGMGAVYTVEQLSTGRERALKLMHPELVGDGAMRAKFVQEARIGARVKSDHVVEVVAAGVDDATGVPYLAMELLEGENLEARLHEEPLTSDEAYAILEQLCHAVAAAHAGGIVHRDLKPENVFLRKTRTGTGGAAVVKVLDFGIAKVVEEARTSNNTGALGSPFWMAPEQTERRATITPATDVWAIGLIAFNLFAGKSFWKTANDGGSSLTAFMRELVLEPIPPASTRAAEWGAAERMPQGFDAWFAKCVTREPAERFHDAGVAWQALASTAGKRSWTLPTAHETPKVEPQVRTANMALARTLPHTADLSPEEDEPQHVPVAASKWPLFAGLAFVAAAVGGGIFATMHVASSSPVTPTPTIATGKTSELICPDGMASIPSGKLSMGTADGESDERPVHDVQLNAFCIDLSEVTVAQYDTCAKDGACPLAGKAVEWSGIQAHDHAVWDGFCNEGKVDRATHPINCITSDQARAFCKHQDKRLPSEDEWEYAARGTEGRTYPWGNDRPSATFLNACGTECAAQAKLLNIELTALYPSDDAFVGTAPVRSFSAGRSPQGVFDLGGNVSEWTSSAFCPYPGSNCNTDLRSTRGSSWQTDEMRDARSASRKKTSPAARTADLGFRCAK